MTKDLAEVIFDDARYIFQMSRLTDVRRKARDIAKRVFSEFKLERGNPEDWNI